VTEAAVREFFANRNFAGLDATRETRVVPRLAIPKRAAASAMRERVRKTRE
jgi:hypothetical protein